MYPVPDDLVGAALVLKGASGPGTPYGFLAGHPSTPSRHRHAHAARLCGATTPALFGWLSPGWGAAYPGRGSHHLFCSSRVTRPSPSPSPFRLVRSVLLPQLPPKTLPIPLLILFLQQGLEWFALRLAADYFLSTLFLLFVAAVFDSSLELAFYRIVSRFVSTRTRTVVLSDP